MDMKTWNPIKAMGIGESPDPEKIKWGMAPIICETCGRTLENQCDLSEGGCVDLVETLDKIFTYLQTAGYMSKADFAQQISGHFGSKFEKMVCGAIQDTINAHGAINNKTKSSLAKRITRQILEVIRQEKHSTENV